MSNATTHTSCLDDERLACFVEEILPAAQRVDVDTHLSACDDCFERVAVARWVVLKERALAGAPFPVTLAERRARDRAKGLFRAPAGARAVFRLLRGALDLVQFTGPAWSPVAAPAVRGDGEGDDQDLWEVRTQLGDYTLRVEVERTGSGCVIAAGVATGTGEPPSGTAVALVRDGALLSLQAATSEPADLAEVGPGRFRVEVRRDGEVTGHAEVVLKAA